MNSFTSFFNIFVSFFLLSWEILSLARMEGGNLRNSRLPLCGGSQEDVPQRGPSWGPCSGGRNDNADDAAQCRSMCSQCNSHAVFSLRARQAVNPLFESPRKPRAVARVGVAHSASVGWLSTLTHVKWRDVTCESSRTCHRRCRTIYPLFSRPASRIFRKSNLRHTSSGETKKKISEKFFFSWKIKQMYQLFFSKKRIYLEETKKQRKMPYSV